MNTAPRTHHVDTIGDLETGRMSAAEIIREMRGWLAECDWPDVDREDIEAMSGERIIAAVQRHFDGGVSAFMDTLGIEVIA